MLHTPVHTAARCWAAAAANRCAARPLFIASLSCHHTTSSTSSSTSSPPPAAAQPPEPDHQLLREVCSAFGVHLHDTVELRSCSEWGLSLCFNNNSTITAITPHQQHQQQQPPGPLIAVPLDLVLSVSIPGCSPAPDQMTPELQQLLHHSAVSHCWEMQVAALLLWALRRPPQSRIGGFWQRYRPLLPRGVQDCSSLLVWSRAELQELQVG